MSYFVDRDEVLFLKTLKFSFLFYLVIGMGVAFVHLPIPKQADIKHLSKRIAKLILEAPQAALPPKIVKPPSAKVKSKTPPKKIVLKASPKPAEPAKKKVTKNIPKKKHVKPKATPHPSDEQNRELVRKSGLLASLIAEEDGALGQIIEDAQLEEVLSSVHVISSTPTKKKNPSQLRTEAHRPSNIGQVDSLIAGLGTSNKGNGVQLAKREIVTVTEISSEYGRSDGKGHGLGRGIGLQLKGTGSGKAAIDYDAIARVVDKYKGGLVYLYNKALRTNPTLKGTVTVEFSIDENGKVLDAHITTSTMNHANLEKTLVNRINRWKFPKLYHGIIVVTYPFVFFPV